MEKIKKSPFDQEANGKKESDFHLKKLATGKRVFRVIIRGINCSLHLIRQSRTESNKKEAEHQKYSDLYMQMIEAIESKSLYLDPKLTQEDVIRYLGTNRKYVYMALKMYGKINFKGLLNGYRIKYAKSLIQDKVGTGKKILLSDIYVDCGFSTNESFYRTFRNITGTSPGRYVKQIKSELL